MMTCCWDPDDIFSNTGSYSTPGCILCPPTCKTQNNRYFQCHILGNPLIMTCCWDPDDIFSNTGSYSTPGCILCPSTYKTQNIHTSLHNAPLLLSQMLRIMRYKYNKQNFFSKTSSLSHKRRRMQNNVTREWRNGQQCKTNGTRNIVFLYSYLIILYIRDSGNRV